MLARVLHRLRHEKGCAEVIGEYQGIGLIDD
jgi:hypothetical protein